ncbi:MAG: hypothetical protein V4864_06100 [Pseudomonadota bacterium]
MSLAVYAATWVIDEVFPFRFWPLFLGTASVFISGAISAQVLMPHYKVDRVLQLPRLKPFFLDQEYKSIWAAFVLTVAALLIGILQFSGDGEASRVTLQVFSAGWFGFLYTDAMILLRAKFPTESATTGEA